MTTTTTIGRPARGALGAMGSKPRPFRLHGPPPRLAVLVQRRVRRALLGLADRLTPPHAVLYEKSVGMWRTHAIGTIAELGVADELASGPATAGQLAARINVDADALHRVLRAAASEGVVRVDGQGRFSLTRTGQVLCADAPHSLRDWARYFSLKSTAAAWADLTETVRTGQSAFYRVHGMSIWEWLERRPDEEQLFASMMRSRTEAVAPSIVAGYPWPEEGTICDVAGGAGTLLAAILKQRPRARGVVIDGSGCSWRRTSTCAAKGCATAWSSSRVTSSIASAPPRTCTS